MEQHSVCVYCMCGSVYSKCVMLATIGARVRPTSAGRQEADWATCALVALSSLIHSFQRLQCVWKRDTKQEARKPLLCLTGFT